MAAVSLPKGPLSTGVDSVQTTSSVVPQPFSHFVELLTECATKRSEWHKKISELGASIAIMRFFKDAVDYATPKMKTNIVSCHILMGEVHPMPQQLIDDVNAVLGRINGLITTLGAIPKADSRNCKLEHQVHEALAPLLNIDSDSWDREMTLYEFAQKVLPSLYHLRDTTSALHEEFNCIIYTDKRNFNDSLRQLKRAAGDSAIVTSYDSFAATGEGLSTPPAEVLSVQELCGTLSRCYARAYEATSDMGNRTAMLYVYSKTYSKLSVPLQEACKTQFEEWNKDVRFACCKEGEKETIQEELKKAIAAIDTTTTSLRCVSAEDKRRCVVSQEFAELTSSFLNVNRLHKEMSIHDFCTHCTESLATTRSFFETMLHRIEVLETAAHDTFSGNKCYKSALDTFQSTLTGARESSTLAAFLAGTAAAASKILGGILPWGAAAAESATSKALNDSSGLDPLTGSCHADAVSVATAALEHLDIVEKLEAILSHEGLWNRVLDAFEKLYSAQINKKVVTTFLKSAFPSVTIELPLDAPKFATLKATTPSYDDKMKEALGALIKTTVVDVIQEAINKGTYEFSTLKERFPFENFTRLFPGDYQETTFKEDLKHLTKMYLKFFDTAKDKYEKFVMLASIAEAIKQG